MEEFDCEEISVPDKFQQINRLPSMPVGTLIQRMPSKTQMDSCPLQQVRAEGSTQLQKPSETLNEIADCESEMDSDLEDSHMGMPEEKPLKLAGFERV